MVVMVVLLFWRGEKVSFSKALPEKKKKTYLKRKKILTGAAR
jgi:hypothetical protein